MMKNKPVNGGTKSASKGSIICTASNAGIYAFPIAPLYAASKHAVVGLARSLARPLEKENIQINALAPAVLETNIAPSKDLFKPMIVTPMSTAQAAVDKLVSDTSLTGQIAEVHGSNVTLREPTPYVDEDSKKNLETFWYAATSSNPSKPPCFGHILVEKLLTAVVTGRLAMHKDFEIFAPSLGNTRMAAARATDFYDLINLVRKHDPGLSHIVGDICVLFCVDSSTHLRTCMRTEAILTKTCLTLRQFPRHHSLLW